MNTFIKTVLFFISLCFVTNLYAQRNDAERIEALVKAEMELYLKKSPFESNEDYENRLKDSDEKKNEITKKITEEVKAEKMEPIRLKITANDYDAENECFMYQSIKIPVSKKIAERFLNQVIDPDYSSYGYVGNLFNNYSKILFAPQNVEMINGNFRPTSAIIYFDLFSYKNCRELFKLNYAIDHIEHSMTDLSAQVCYVKNTYNNMIYKGPLVKLAQITESSSGKLKENIYYIEWENNTPNLPDNKVIVAEKEQIFTHIEKMPQYPGGERELMAFLSQNIKYPKIAQEQGIQGSVVLRFVVGKNGDITDVTVQRSLDSSCDEEAVRVAKLMPKWISGTQNGNPVDVYYTLPIRFKLQQ